MKSRKKETPKYVAGGMLAAAGTQALLGAGQAAFGYNQRMAAKRLLEDLQRNAPSLQIPTALRRLVNEPIAEEYMEAQEMGAQRRTAQAIDALGKGGSRTLGLVPSVLENERIGEQQRAGQYEQARQNALGQFANAETRIQDFNMNKYLQDLEAARGSMEAGEQNIFGGLSQVGRGGVSLFPTQTAKDGAILKTKGVFSHRKNPKDLIDRETGEVEAELTGQETIFNKEDSEVMEEFANTKGKEKELQKFIKGRYKKFRSKRKNQ